MNVYKELKVNDQHRVGWATAAEPAGATVFPRSDSYFLRETSHLAESIKRSIFNFGPMKSPNPVDV